MIQHFRQLLLLTLASACATTVGNPINGIVSDTNFESCTLHFSSSAPALVDSGGRLIFVEQPIIAEVRTGTLVLGSPVSTWPVLEKVRYRLVGLVLKPGGDLDTVLKPPSVARVQAPRLLSDKDGVAQILWGTSRDTTIGGESKMDVLWHGAFDGVRWSRPEEVLRGSKLSWDAFVPATLATKDQLYVATIRPDDADSIGSQRLWISRRVAGEWQSQSPVQLRGFMALQEVRLQDGGHGAIVLTYSGFKVTSSSAGRLPFVNVIRSTDSGGTWSAPETIRLGPHGTMVMLGGFHRQRDGTLHLFWHAQQDGTDRSNAVFHEVSSDGGQHWKQADSLVVPEGFSVLRTNQVSDALVMTIRRSDLRLVQAVVGPRATLQILPTKAINSIPTTVVRSNGTIETWWSEYSAVALRDSSAYGATMRSYRITTAINCR